MAQQDHVVMVERIGPEGAQETGRGRFPKQPERQVSRQKFVVLFASRLKR